MDTSRSNLASRYHIFWEKQSYINMCYLFASFPLGLVYFVLLVAGIAIGLATSIIWIGVPMLMGMMSTWWQLAAFERYMAQGMLHVSIPPMAYPLPRQRTFWQKLQDQLSDPMTWKTLGFLFLKFPISIFCFVIVLTLPILSIAIAAVSLVIWLISAPFVILILILLNSPYTWKHLQRYLLLAVTGFGLGLITLLLLNQLAAMSGYLARVMLGMSDTELRLREAQALAEQERIRAEQAERRRQQLVTNVSHELRTPVASVAGHLESLLIATREGTATPPPETLYKYLSIAHQETKRLGTLVEELLSLARMESNELRLDIQEVCARDAVEEAYHILQPLAQQERQVTIVRGCALNLPPILADYQRLVQILLNLVRNAITYTPAGGIVSITLEQAGDARYLALTVEDNGIGIPARDLQHIFERFYRADASRTRASGGSGLGLAIVHDFVTAMGGTITAESTEGRGSRFCVLLRIAAPASLQNGRAISA